LRSLRRNPLGRTISGRHGSRRATRSPRQIAPTAESLPILRHTAVMAGAGTSTVVRFPVAMLGRVVQDQPPVVLSSYYRQGVYLQHVQASDAIGMNAGALPSYPRKGASKCAASLHLTFAAVVRARGCAAALAIRFYIDDF